MPRTPIPPERVNKRNTNLRKYDDQMWRELRKTRFKKSVPNPYANEMAAEEIRTAITPDPVFDHDMAVFINTMLSPREADLFRLFLYGGKLNQWDIANILGISQSTVHNELETILNLVKEYYYGAAGRQ